MNLPKDHPTNKPINLLQAVVIIVIAVCTATFTGCSTGTPVVAASGGTYTVTKSGTTGFTPLGALRKQAYKEANRFAASKGKEAEIVSVNEVPQGFGRWPQVDLRFRLISPNRDSGASGAVLTVSSEAAHDAMGRTTEAATTVQISQDAQFYNELKRLGELREKGILTEDEFQKEKRRLMDARNTPDNTSRGVPPSGSQ